MTARILALALIAALGACGVDGAPVPPSEAEAEAEAEERRRGGITISGSVEAGIAR